MNLNLYGLIGHTLTHSFSKKYFTEKFQKENISNCSYELFSIENINLLPQLINENSNLKGLNVTIPYKEAVIPFLNEIDIAANQIGAVNCIKVINNNGLNPTLIGYNTDEYGFRQSIKPFLESHHERALIIGTGGSAKAVYYVLNQIGIDCFYLTRKKTTSNNKILDYSELNKNVFDSIKLIINCSPVGMFPNTLESPCIPYKYIVNNHLCIDLIYNPEETTFLKKSKNQGAKTLNGLSMLHLQAEKSWEIWNKSF